VKQIEVAAASVEGGHKQGVCSVCRPYIRERVSWVPRWSWMLPLQMASRGKW